MFDTSDVQIAALLRNRAMLRKALAIAALEVSGGNGEVARVRAMLWILDADTEIERERKAQA